MSTLLNALGPMLASAGDLMLTISSVLTQTGAMLTMPVDEFRSGAWMLAEHPEFYNTNANAALLAMGGNMSMATAAYTVVSKPAVESAGAIVTNLGAIVATLPDVLNAMTDFFSTLVDFLSA